MGLRGLKGGGLVRLLKYVLKGRVRGKIGRKWSGRESLGRGRNSKGKKMEEERRGRKWKGDGNGIVRKRKDGSGSTNYGISEGSSFSMKYFQNSCFI